MPVHVEVRVPYVAQTDAASGTGIRCGAAAIQSILYGRDDGFFEPGGSTLRPDVDVTRHQDAVWRTISEVSQQFVHDTGGDRGPTEGQQVCHRVAGQRECWATHPGVMVHVLKKGVELGEGETLTGVPTHIDVVARTVHEQDIVGALLQSLELGVGAALLVDRMHWVVVHRCVPVSPFDFEVQFHDPQLPGNSSWQGLDAMFADVIDNVPTTPHSQTIVVGARVDGQLPPVPDPTMFLAAARHRAAAERTRSSDGRWPEEMRLRLSENPARREPLDGARLLRMSRVSARRGDYRLMQYGRDGVATVLVAASETTGQPLLVATESDGQSLPTLLDPDQIRRVVDGRHVEGDGWETVLDSAQIEIQDTLIWQRCDQSSSMLLPFYVIRQPADGRRPPITVYARIDGQLTPHLTRERRG